MCAVALLIAPAPSYASAALFGVWRMARPEEVTDPRQVTPPIPEPSLRPEVEAKYREQQRLNKAASEDGRPFARDRDLCIPEGVPRMLLTDSPIEILQSPGQITLITEFLSQVRRIDITRAAHPSSDELLDGFFGDSIGRWEGETLVVHTVGLKPRVLLFKEVPHSEEVQITERYTLVTPDIMSLEITIEDPQVLTAPWVVRRSFVRRPDLRLAEYVCQESNRYYRDADGRLAVRRE